MAIKLSTLRKPKLRRMIDLMMLFVASSFPVDMPYLNVATINFRFLSIFWASFSNSGIPQPLVHLSHLPKARQAFLKLSCLKIKRNRSLIRYALYNSGFATTRYSSCACCPGVRFSGFFRSANRFFSYHQTVFFSHHQGLPLPSRPHETGQHNA